MASFNQIFLRYPSKIVVALLHFVINLCARVDQRISWCAKDCLLLTHAGPRFLPVFPLHSFSKNISHHGEGRCTSLHSILSAAGVELGRGFRYLSLNCNHHCARVILQKMLEWSSVTYRSWYIFREGSPAKFRCLELQIFGAQSTYKCCCIPEKSNLDNNFDYQLLLYYTVLSGFCCLLVVTLLRFRLAFEDVMELLKAVFCFTCLKLSLLYNQLFYIFTFTF